MSADQTASPALFESHPIRRVYDEKTEVWWFSVIDIVQVLTQHSDYKAARNYWKVLKNRLAKEGSEVVTDCNQLKLPAADGKRYLTDVARAETLLRLVQSVPSPKAEPIKYSGQCPFAMACEKLWGRRKAFWQLDLFAFGAPKDFTQEDVFRRLEAI
jgi:hypothetical protein